MRRLAGRVEFAAGLVAGVLGVAGLLVLMFVPIPVCTVPASHGCPAADLRAATLFSAGAETGIWLFLTAMMIALLTGDAAQAGSTPVRRRRTLRH